VKTWVFATKTEAEENRPNLGPVEEDASKKGKTQGPVDRKAKTQAKKKPGLAPMRIRKNRGGGGGENSLRQGEKSGGGEGKD